MRVVPERKRRRKKNESVLGEKNVPKKIHTITFSFIYSLYFRLLAYVSFSYHKNSLYILRTSSLSIMYTANIFIF